MLMVSSDLWDLIPGGRQVDPTALARAIERQIESGDLDFRTRLLIRDSLSALAGYWGQEQFMRWIEQSGRAELIRHIQSQSLGDPGFSSLRRSVMTPTLPDTILQFLRDLGGRLREPARIDVGGSAALVIPGLLSRMTEDIDVVGEVPASIRNEHNLLERLMRSYGLRLAHFQSHYLPDGWQTRVHSLGKFRELEVHLLDVYDVCASKLFSSREKDLDDLRHLGGKLDKETFKQRLLTGGKRLRGEEKLRKAAEHNWYVLYGEPLPE